MSYCEAIVTGFSWKLSGTLLRVTCDVLTIIILEPNLVQKIWNILEPYAVISIYFDPHLEKGVFMSNLDYLGYYVDLNWKHIGSEYSLILCNIKQ